MASLRRRAGALAGIVAGLGVACAAGGLAIAVNASGLSRIGGKTALLALATAVAICGTLVIVRAVVRVSIPARMLRAIGAVRASSLRISQRTETVIAGAVLVAASLVIGAEAVSDRARSSFDGGAIFLLAGALAIAATLGSCHRILAADSGQPPSTPVRDAGRVSAVYARDAALAASAIALIAAAFLIAFCLSRLS